MDKLILNTNHEHPLNVINVNFHWQDVLADSGNEILDDFFSREQPPICVNFDFDLSLLITIVNCKLLL